MRMPSTGRGLPPKIRPDTVFAYVLDDSTSVARNRCRDGDHLGALGAVSVGAAVTGRTRRARSFTPSSILYALSSQRVIDVLTLPNWTQHLLVRLDADAVGQDFFACVAGLDTDAGAPGSNILSCIGVGTREPFFYWESAAGTNRLAAMTGYDLPFGVWTLLTFRRSATTTVEAFVNANPWGTLDMVADNIGGGALATTRTTIGGQTNAAGTGVAFQCTARISNWFLDAGLRTDEEIQQDYRRVMGLGRPSSVHLRLKVEDGLGVLVDLTDPTVMGADFVNEVRIRETIDDPCAVIDCTIARNIGNLAAAPLRTDSRLNLEDVLDPTSYNPHLYGYREVIADVARTPLWVPPATTDWFERFRGRVDVVDDGAGDDVTIRGRDQGGYLVDRQIDEPRAYPQTFGGGGCGASAQSREIVMAEILADNGSLATLFTPVASLSCRVSPDPPELPRGSLMQALRTEAGALAWDCKFQWDPVTEAFRLTFFDPGRDTVVPDVLITRDEVIAVSGGEQSLANVRTRVKVTSADSSTLNTEGQPLPATYEAIDAVAEAAFDERLMEVVEEATRGIDTSAERQRMADGILADVSTLRRNGSTMTTGIPEIELYDYARFNGNGLHYTAQQLAGARGVEHIFTREATTSRIQAEGQPSAGFKRWLDIEAGRAGPLPLRSPADALKERLGPGMIEGVLEFVERSSYPGGMKFLNLKNGDFSRFTRGDAYTPDAWTMAAGTWATDVTAETSTLLSGGRALRFVNTTGKVQGQPVAIVGGGDYPISLDVLWQRVSGDDLPELGLEWLTAAKAAISTTTLYPGSNFPAAPATTGAWITSRADGIAPPSTARFVVVTIKGRQVGGAYGAILVDTVGLYRGARELRARTEAVGTWGYHAAAGGPGNIQFGDVATAGFYDRGGNLVIDTSVAAYWGYHFLCKEPGVHKVTAVGWPRLTVGSAGAKTYEMQLVKNGIYSAAGIRTGGTVISRAFDSDTWTTLARRALRLTEVVELVQDDRLSVDYDYLTGANTGLIGAGFTDDDSRFSVKLQTND